MADDAENLDGGLDELEGEASGRWRLPGSETFYRVDIQWCPGQVVRGSMTVAQFEESDFPSLEEAYAKLALASQNPRSGAP